MTKRIVSALCFSVALFTAGLASAQQAGGAKGGAAGGGKVITIGEVTIVGRVQKPIASVDVSKIQAKLTLAELRQPFLDRIEQATLKEPF
ncbi:hypothetical protein LZC95_17930 [Pendulispora brunnea]|uniref:POTRA domain-containing protein n=1 Tax=Pendulispora brunnea TaxID=2905690 RepID=A0ABZ2KJG6_9BACT